MEHETDYFGRSTWQPTQTGAGRRKTNSSGSRCASTLMRAAATRKSLARALPFVVEEKAADGSDEQPAEGFILPSVQEVAADATDFRRVLYTAPDEHGQLTFMVLRPGENIGAEVHPATAQFVIVVAGHGEARLGQQVATVAPGAMIVIPAGVEHDVTNISPSEPLSLAVFYTEAQHVPGSIEPLKQSERLAESVQAISRRRPPLRH